MDIISKPRIWNCGATASSLEIWPAPQINRVEEAYNYISFVYTDETGEPDIKVTPLHGTDVQVLRCCEIVLGWWHLLWTDSIVTFLQTVTPATLHWIKCSSGVVEYT